MKWGRMLFFFFFLSLYLLAMWNANPFLLMREQELVFMWNETPSWRTFFEREDLHVIDVVTDPNKMSHILGTMTLSFLAFHWLGWRWKVITALTVFVILVEMVQPFFGRTAWFVDVFLNILGVGLGTFLVWYYRNRWEVVT